jgi:hypothetical protein
MTHPHQPQDDIERFKDLYVAYRRDHSSLPPWDDLNPEFVGALILMYFRGAADGREEMHEHYRISAGFGSADLLPKAS